MLFGKILKGVAVAFKEIPLIVSINILGLNTRFPGIVNAMAWGSAIRVSEGGGEEGEEEMG
jgi:hypothetical protein